MKPIADIKLDSLQIFFPWDDDLVTYLFQSGYGKSGLGKKATPVIYSDSGDSTRKSKPFKRDYVIAPYFFGKTETQLGWKATAKPQQPIIPTEKPKLQVFLKGNNVIFKVAAKIKGRNEYHLEYPRSPFGIMNHNWAIFYISLYNMNTLYELLRNKDMVLQELPLINEQPQKQREEMDYVALPLLFYQFSLSGFEYAIDLLKLNGYSAKKIPSLVYTPNFPKKKMNPVIKCGLVHTTGKDGFDVRRPQFALKISQRVISKSKRGKRAKVKGLLRNTSSENVFIIDRDDLVKALFTLKKLAFKRYKSKVCYFLIERLIVFFKRWYRKV